MDKQEQRRVFQDLVDAKIDGSITREEETQLVQEVTNMAHQAAYGVGIPYNPVMSKEDAIQQALLDVFTKIERYDKDQSSAASYVYYVIYWSLQDYKRDNDAIPKYVSRIVGAIRNAQDHLSQELGREPSFFEIAEAIGSTAEKVSQVICYSRARKPVSIDTTVVNTENSGTLLRDLLVSDSLDPSEITAGTKTFSGLTDIEVAVSYLYFYDGRSLPYIADLLNLTSPRITQIRSQAIQKLKENLTDAV